jgi:hypothetical protein
MKRAIKIKAKLGAAPRSNSSSMHMNGGVATECHPYNFKCASVRVLRKQ